MRNLALALIALVCLLVALPARADGTSNLGFTERRAEVQRASRMKAAGIAITSIGTTAFVVGIVLSAITISRGIESETWTFDTFLAGACLSGVGGALDGIGVPLWAMGAGRERKAELSVSAGGLRVQF